MLFPIRPALTLAAALIAAAASVAGSVSAAVQPVSPTQELAALLSPHQARARPTSDSASRGMVAGRRPITEARTVLPVLGHSTDAAGRRWLNVMLPGRPNGRTGWIRRSATVTLVSTWQLVVDTSSRRVDAYRNGLLVRTFPAVIGKPSTPTPHGRFFVEESVRLPAGKAGAPFALALSARSNVLQEFDGGPGQVALHGLANVGGIPGTAVSHGCVRLTNSAMRWLVARIGRGDPVTIRG
jgi:lipoprotein-anchoring transpeptidase ErfK/SrfK